MEHNPLQCGLAVLQEIFDGNRQSATLTSRDREISMKEQRSLVRQVPRISFGASQTNGVSIETISRCESSLEEVNSYVSQFYEALTLYEFSSLESRRLQSSMLHKWCFIGARDGAMAIFHFAKSIESVNYWTFQEDYLKQNVDKTKFRKVFRDLNQSFPNFEAVRHAVAHAAEVTKNKKAIEEHAFKGQYDDNGIKINNSNVIIKNSIANNRFLSTFNGEIQEYHIHENTLIALIDIRDTLFSAFENVPINPKRE